MSDAQTKDSKWKRWEDSPEYGETLYKRATGDAPEMESSKASAQLLKPIMKDGDLLIDVGCGAGHYFRSYKKEIKTHFRYLGVDATPYYIELAKKAYPGEKNIDFKQGDIFNLPLADQHGDVVVCNNVFLHLPSIQKPLDELMRIAKRTVLLRTMIGTRSFRILDVEGEGDEFEASGEPRQFHFYNIYSRAYLTHLLKKNPRVQKFEFSEDWNYSAANIESAVSEQPGAQDITRMLGKWQVNGYILQPWTFLRIDLK